MTFAPLWNHLANCDRCSQVDLDLCREGQRIQRAVFEAAAERIAPIPKQSDEAKS